MGRIVLGGMAAFAVAGLGIAAGEADPAVAASAAPPAFAQCTVCHAAAPGAAAKVGPNLWGIYGQAGGRAPFAYSGPFKRSALVWNDATLDKWLESPAKVVPGTRMIYGGMKNAAQRKAVIAYLKTLK